MNNKTLLIQNHYDDIIRWLQNEEYKEIYILLKINVWFEHRLLYVTLTTLGESANDNKLLKIVIDKLIKHSLSISPSIINNIITGGHIDLFIMLLDRSDINLQSYSLTIIKSKCAIKFLDIFLERGQQLNIFNIRNAIKENIIDVVRYSFNNGYDVQSAYNELEMDMLLRCDTNMLKLLNANIDITTNIDVVMLSAILQNSLENVMFLIPFVDNINKYLRNVCLHNNISIMKYLLQSGADITVLEDDMPKVLNIDTIIFLDKCGLKIGKKILDKSLLHDFINKNNTNNFSYFIEYGASMNYIFHKQKVGKKINNYNYPLQHAIYIGKINYIKYLCENYYDLIYPEFDALFLMACAYGQCDIIKYLHSLGATINDLSLIVACYFGKLNVIELLLSYGMDGDIRENLFCVLEDGYYKRGHNSRIYDEVINKDCIFKTRNMQWGNVIGDFSVIQNMRNLIKKLIPLNIPIPNDSEFLSFKSSIIFDIDILQYYLDCGNDFNKNSESVVETCIKHSHPKVTKFLLDNGANWPSQECLNTYCTDNEEYRVMFNL